jgi:hypothetical protein
MVRMTISSKTQLVGPLIDYIKYSKSQLVLVKQLEFLVVHFLLTTTTLHKQIPTKLCQIFIAKGLANILYERFMIVIGHQLEISLQL